MPRDDIQLTLFAYGGVHPETVESIVKETQFCKNLSFTIAGQDALISRSRSRVATDFLRKSSAATLVMVDHDISWNLGDVAKLAKQAQEARAVVGGLYACRGVRCGWASRLCNPHAIIQPGGTMLHETIFVGGGFLAIPKDVLLTMRDTLLGSTDQAFSISECVGEHPGETFYDFFRPFASSTALGTEYISEDWAFSRRAHACSIPVLVSEAPYLVHYGERAYFLEDG